MKAPVALLILLLSQASNSSCLIHLKPSNLTIDYLENPYIKNSIIVNVSIKNIVQISEDKSAKLVGLSLSSGRPNFRVDLAMKTDGISTKSSFEIDSRENYENFRVVATLEPNFEYEKASDCTLSYNISKILKHNKAQSSAAGDAASGAH